MFNVHDVHSTQNNRVLQTLHCTIGTMASLSRLCFVFSLVMSSSDSCFLLSSCCSELFASPPILGNISRDVLHCGHTPR